MGKNMAMRCFHVACLLLLCEKKATFHQKKKNKNKIGCNEAHKHAQLDTK